MLFIVESETIEVSLERTLLLRRILHFHFGERAVNARSVQYIHHARYVRRRVAPGSDLVPVDLGKEWVSPYIVCIVENDASVLRQYVGVFEAAQSLGRITSQQRLKEVAGLRTEATRHRHILVSNVPHHLALVPTKMRWDTKQHFVDEGAKRPPVCLEGVTVV